MGEQDRIGGEILDRFLASHPAHLQTPQQHRTLWEEMVSDYGSQVEQMHPHTRITFYYGGASRLAWAGDWSEAQELYLEVERLVGRHGWEGISQGHMLTFELGLCAYMLGQEEEAYVRWESVLRGHWSSTKLMAVSGYWPTSPLALSFPQPTGFAELSAS